MKRYLINLTFYAGSDDKEDTDKKLFVLSLKENATEEEIKSIFKEVNSLLDTYNENSEFPLSYEQGLNIDTFIKGVALYTKGSVEEIYNNCGLIGDIDNCYFIEQWQ